ELLEELMARLAAILQVDTVVVLLLDETDRVLIPRAAHGFQAELEQDVRIPLGRGFAGRVAATRRPVWIEDLASASVHSPLLAGRGLRSLLGVPLLVEGRAIGVVHVGSLRWRRFDDDEVSLLQLAADRAALAIEQARIYERQRSVAETLQRSMLPRSL